MLSYLRRNAGSWMIKVILVGIALSFIIGFGILPTLRDPGGEEGVMARVGDEIITRGEWNRAYENMVQFYKEMYKDRFSDEMIRQMQLRETALDNLIHQALQRQEAERMHLKVSDEELQNRIRSLPYFQRNGAFSKELYLNLLRRNRMTPGDFEKMQREEMLVEKLQELIQGSVKVSEQELRDRYALDEERVDLQVLVLDPRGFEDAVPVDEKALNTYFEEHPDPFLTPEKVRVEYVQIPLAAYRDGVKLYTGDVEEYYDTHLDEFSHPEEVRLRHILLRVPPGAEPSVLQEKRKELEEIREKIMKGGDFAALAREHSEDPSSRAGGDLGYVKREQLAPEVAQAAFVLKPGQISEIVTSPYGIAVLKAEDHRASRVDPLDEVQEKIREILREEGAWRQARRKAEEVVWSAREGKGSGGLASAGEDAPAVEQTGFFARGDALAGAAGDPAFQEAAFATDLNSVSDAVKGKDGYFVLRPLERKGPEKPAFVEVKEAVEKRYRTEKSGALAREKAGEIAGLLRTGKPVEEVLKEKTVASIDTGYFSRLSEYVPRIGPSPEMVERAFSLSENDPVAAEPLELNGRFFVIRFKDRKPPDWQAFQEQRETIRSRQLDRKKEEVLRQWLSDLRKQRDVKVSPLS